MKKLFDTVGKNLRVEKIEYARFLALPKGISKKNQKAFSKQYGISETTLSKRKNDEDVIKLKNQFMKSYFSDKTPEVLDALYKACTKDRNVYAIKLRLEQFSEELKKEDNHFVITFGSGGIGPSQFIKPSN